MSEDIEARIKALEEKLNPSPDKVSSMKATNRLKQTLDEMKEDGETQEDVVWKVIREALKVPDLEKHAEKVPALEEMIQDLEKKLKELEGDEN